MLNNQGLSHLYAFLTVLLWSSAYVFTKTALAYFSVTSLGVLRCAVAALCLSGLLLVRGGMMPPWRAFPRFILSGASGFALYLLAFNKGTETLNPTTSCLLISLSPLITAILAQLFWKERLGFKRWLAIMLAFCGVTLMMLWDASLSVAEGIVWLLIASFLISFYSLLQRGLVAAYGALQVTTFSFIAGTLLLLPFLSEAVAQSMGASEKDIALVLFLGACPSAAAYMLWTKALSLASTTNSVTNYMFLTPFLSLLLEFVIMGQTPGMGVFIGGGIILGSLVLFTRAG